jgi:hypothetical protein
MSVILAMIFSMLRKNDEMEMCKELEKNIKKYSKYNNIHKSLLYDYHLFCRDNF